MFTEWLTNEGLKYFIEPADRNRQQINLPLNVEKNSDHRS
jgi:hypothetical protein